MKKIFTLLSLFMIVGTSINAQLENNTKVGDFTATDINGNTVNLYSILDEGKTVIVDVFAAWCEPCWNYHEAKILENLYQTYGPAGTDELVVIGIEAEGTNTNEQLTGATPGTTRADFSLGDWTAGISYIIIDDASLASNPFSISYFPTLYTIYPNRMVLESGQLTEDAYGELIADAVNEGLATADVDARSLLYLGEAEGCGTSEASVRIQNLGLTELTSAVITMNDGTEDVISYDWNGSMDTYDIIDVDLGSFDVTATADYTISISPTGTDGNLDNNDIISTILKSPAAPTTKVEFVIVTDFYPGETEWSIVGDDGVEIEGGTFNAGPEAYGGGGDDANREFRYDVEIPNEAKCYKVEITDSYGDGLTSADLSIHPYPQFALYDEFGEELKAFADEDPFFDFETDFGFSFEGLSSVASIDFIDEVKMFPNPAYDRLNVEINSNESEKVNIVITDLLGRNILTQTNTILVGQNNLVIPTTAISAGQYIMTMTSNGQLNSYKFTVAN